MARNREAYEREESKAREALLQVSKLEQSEQILQGKVAMTEGKVEQCARFEVETQVLTNKLTLLEENNN